MDKDKLIDDACLRLAKLLKEKNRLYGSSFDKSVDKWGKMAIGLRIEDKLNRFDQLVKGEEDTVGESMIDTVKDIAGYGILAVIYLEDELFNDDTDEKVRRDYF